MGYINIDETKWCSILEDYKEEWILETKTIFGSFYQDNSYTFQKYNIAYGNCDSLK